MKKLYHLALLFIFLQSNKFYSQEGNHGGFINPIPDNSITASPDVMAFQKFNALPVNLYTGKIDLSIPIYVIKSGNITVPITLTYNSGGVKVDDIASSVGTGWNINAGGSIVRNIKDLPDNEAGFSLNAENDWDLGMILQGWIASLGYNRKAGCASPREIVTEWSSQNRHAVYYEDVVNSSNNVPGGNPAGFGFQVDDLSPDVFMVNAPGLSTEFTSINTSSLCIYPNNNDGFTTTFLDNSGARMDALEVDVRNVDGFGFYAPGNPGSHYGRMTYPIMDFFNFLISDANGLQYKFDEIEVSESFYSPLEPQPSGTLNSWKNTWATMEALNYRKQIHTWNVSEIKDKKTNRIVNFLYESYANSEVVENTFVNDHVMASNGPTSLNQNNSCFFAHNTFSIGRSAEDPYLGAFENWEKHPLRKRLQTIQFDGGLVEFIYAQNRTDYLGEKALTEIRVKDFNNKLIKTVKFRYGYFDSKENCSGPECKRLRLDGVDIEDGLGNKNSYGFEYDYVNKLPKRGSLQQDYLGFYNNNGVTGNSNSTTTYTPKLYFYPNQGQHSILPFQRTNAPNYQLIPGSVDLTPNSYSLTGLLKKVVYPTGGSSEFIYENNTFKFMGEEYVGGGARIASQTLKDGANIVKKIDYEYEEADGSSSGYINNIPIYGYPHQFQLSPFSLYEAAVYDKPKGGVELTTGSFVGYSKVVEKEVGNGFTEYHFTSSKNNGNIPEGRTPTNGHQIFSVQNSYQCSDAIINNSGYPSITYQNNDYQRGKPIYKKVYSESNVLLKSEDFGYLDKVYATQNLQKNVRIRATEYSTGIDAYDVQSHMLTVTSQLKVAKQLGTSLTESLFNSGNQLVTQQLMEYKTSFPILDKRTIIDSKGDNYVTNYTYVLDKNPTESSVIQGLYDQNRIFELLETENRKNVALLSKETMVYNNFSNLILPAEIKKLKQNGTEFTAFQFLDYDLKGNLVEMTQTSEGPHVYYVWGYYHQYPIAKIENLDSSNIDANIQNLINAAVTASNADDSVADENILRTALNNLRSNLPTSMVTSYTYDPLVGVTSITNPNGLTTYYEYDSFNRLKNVKDNDQKLLNDYQYHYKGQN
ncbi:RHS repeat domain-containing protein [Flagellimonas beolgyonensis]|uniref:RHS repeat domain-containing protein n=1 Tax=Flagellimonas beolgyonensis TaxID=864064 RepID=UPI000F8CE6AB|nr:RHS repeat domain-containing protein [Allomuricauda beolgyonensis]